jgi:glycosyltransferase involved in cell wall biosynthesis
LQESLCAPTSSSERKVDSTGEAKRIAVWHDPPPGGARRAFDELLTRLAQRHTVEIFHSEFQAHRSRRGAPYWNDWQTLRDFQRLVVAERALASRIDAARFDVVMTSVLATAVAPALPRFLKAPSLYYCHEPPRRFYEPWCRPEAGPQTAYERARRLWRLPAQRYLDNWSKRADIDNVRSATGVLTNSYYTASRVRDVYGRTARVCYLGVDHQRFRPPREAPPATRVLSVGSLEAHKGFDFLIRALSRVNPSRRPRLTIVGRGGHPRMPALLRRLASSLQVDLELCTELSDDQLAEAYRAHAVFVFGAHYEPFGLVVLEAMASGLPVVAVDEGGVRESVRHAQTGVLVPRDETAFAAALERLLAAPAERKAMGAAARDDAVAIWNWESAACRLENLIEGVAVGETRQ